MTNASRKGLVLDGVRIEHDLCVQLNCIDSVIIKTKSASAKVVC